MLVDAAGDAPDGLLRHASKDGIAELLGHGGSHSRHAVFSSLAWFLWFSAEMLTRDNQRASNCPSRATQGHEVDVHRVHNVLEVKRNLHIENLKCL